MATLWPMIIAIDGPAGAGKSTVAKELARRLGFAYVNTGAMYRAVALCALEKGLVLPDNEAAIIELARELPIHLREGGTRVFVGEREVGDLIRTPQVGDFTSQISALPGVREVIVAQQRRIGRESDCECGGAVLEGRDIQTVVFPDAEVKIFLTATPRERARRRLHEWQEKTPGESAPFSLDEAERDIAERDFRDSTRETSPLRAAPDAENVVTDEMSPDEVIEHLARLVAARRGLQGHTACAPTT
jgi:cytidylate kinase